MRRVTAPLTVILIPLLAACGSGGARTAASPSPTVSYQVDYLVYADSSGNTVDVNYTDDSGRAGKDSGPADLWKKSVTVGPTFPEIDLSATLSGPFALSSAVTCEIKINKLVVANNVGTVGNCSTTFALKNFSALASASPSPSPAVLPSPTEAAPVTRDPACRYASDAEVSEVVSAHLGGAQTVLFTNGMYGGCGYHFTNEITANDVVITYWRGTVVRNEGTSVSGLGGKARWDSRTLSVQRSGGVVTIEVRLPGEDSQDKEIGIELYKLIRGRIK